MRFERHQLESGYVNVSVLSKEDDKRGAIGKLDEDERSTQQGSWKVYILSADGELSTTHLGDRGVGEEPLRLFALSARVSILSFTGNSYRINFLVRLFN